MTLTDEQIIKALEYCVDKGYCPECPCYKNNADCELEYDVLKLINRQKAEIDILIRKKDTLRDEIAEQQARIERLRTECGKQSVLWSEHFEACFQTAKETIRPQTIKEFAERFREKADTTHRSQIFSTEIEIEYKITKDEFDEIVKEMGLE